jgi:hypothetical protein
MPPASQPNSRNSHPTHSPEETATESPVLSVQAPGASKKPNHRRIGSYDDAKQVLNQYQKAQAAGNGKAEKKESFVASKPQPVFKQCGFRTRGGQLPNTGSLEMDAILLFPFVTFLSE